MMATNYVLSRSLQALGIKYLKLYYFNVPTKLNYAIANWPLLIQNYHIYFQEIPEKSPVKIKNFGIWLRYESRSGVHNMYREYRDLSVGGAVTQCYRDMGARHRARAHSIQVTN